jgi:hypothetical protein
VVKIIVPQIRTLTPVRAAQTITCRATSITNPTTGTLARAVGCAQKFTAHLYDLHHLKFIPAVDVPPREFQPGSSPGTFGDGRCRRMIRREFHPVVRWSALASNAITFGLRDEASRARRSQRPAVFQDTMPNDASEGRLSRLRPF